MGAVAGSGGYYVTTSAQKVVAHPGTITGSIGVIAGKLVSAGLMERLLFHREQITRGRHSAMWSSDQAFNDIERSKLGELVDRSYRLFLERVAAARGRSVAEIEAVAGGRVWTGRQAVEHGLVDELGGLERGIAAARRLGGLPAGAPVRERRRGRRELGPVPATATAVLEHALRALAALNQAGVWWLCPIVSRSGS